MSARRNLEGQEGHYAEAGAIVRVKVLEDLRTEDRIAFRLEVLECLNEMAQIIFEDGRDFQCSRVPGKQTIWRLEVGGSSH